MELHMAEHKAGDVCMALRDRADPVKLWAPLTNPDPHG